MAFSGIATIATNPAQCGGSDSANFVLLVNTTDPSLKSVANGGFVISPNGYDVRPYVDSGLGTAITAYELEYYNGTTGQVVMWILLTNLSHTVPVTIYLGLGDPSLVSDGSNGASTWAAFYAVYHMGNGTVLNGNDSLGAHNGTLVNGPTAAAGLISPGAGSFLSASSQYIQLGASVNAFNYSAWIKATSFPNAQNTIVGKNGTGLQGVVIFWVTSAGKLEYQAGTGDVLSTPTLSPATLYYVVGQLENPSQSTVLYINGANRQVGTQVSSSITGTNPTQIGSDQAGGGRYFNGLIDEVHLWTGSPSSHSQDWILQEYNNQLNPSTFYSYSAAPLSGGGSTSRRRLGDRGNFGGDRCILDRGIGPNRRGDRGER